MIIEKTGFGPVEVTTIPLPEGLGPDVSGTYTYSGRVLVSVGMAEKGKDWYRVFTIDDDGTGLSEVFEGCIPKKPGANGIRWMCFTDNRRVWLGDYVLECTPDLDHCESAVLRDVVFPEVVGKIPGVFMRWSEPIVAPDMEHVCFTSLTGSGAFNFLGKFVVKDGTYYIEDACIVSSTGAVEPVEGREGCYRLKTQRGGEVKQFIRGGRGMSLAGGGRSISESVIQMLDSEETACITDTLGYEETAILSPDERLAVCMSPRFSPKTDFGILGVIPMSGDMFTRGRYMNVLYQYAIAGARYGRNGNIGPALIDVEKSMSLGRAYQGVDLSDPENKWVYYSPMSWHPDSTRALWNERTRLTAGPVSARLRRVRLLDAAPTAPVPFTRTPDREEIPYALPVEEALKAELPVIPMKILGAEGYAENNVLPDGRPETRYENYSEDGKTYYNGYIRVKTPANMFQPGETFIDADVTVTGEHEGRMRLTLALQADARFQIHLDRTPDENGLPKSRGFSEYDGIRRTVEEMEP
ncbi:MAG: hypothetical protein IJL78_03655 [Lachnospiraceae bacterium]|nr:hypothetical protein [Lachnospiraceae bacterium]